MLEYKFDSDFATDCIYPQFLNLYQDSDPEFKPGNQSKGNVIKELHDFILPFNTICFIPIECAEKFCKIFNNIKENDIQIAKGLIFKSSFPISLIQAIQQLLSADVKGDRILSPFVWSLLMLIRLDSNFFQFDLIDILLEISHKYVNFSTSLLHCIGCLIEISQNSKYNQFFLEQIPKLLALSPKIKDSQAIVRFSQLLLFISKEEMDEQLQHNIGQIFVSFVTHEIVENDMNGVLRIIYEFISFSNYNFKLVSDCGLIQNLSYILSRISNYMNSDIIFDIIEKIAYSEYCTVFLCDIGTASQLQNLLLIKIIKSTDEYKIVCINIIKKLVDFTIKNSEYGNNIFIDYFKKSVILKTLCDYLKNCSFQVKSAISLLLIKLIYLKDIEIIYKILEYECIDFIVESEQLSDFIDPNEIVKSITICIGICDDALLKEHLTEKLEEIKECISA